MRVGVVRNVRPLLRRDRVKKSGTAISTPSNFAMERIIADPDSQITTPPQAFVVLRPVGLPILFTSGSCHDEQR